MRWSDLTPDQRLMAALNRANDPSDYAQTEAEGSVDDKRNWSNRFADGCAALLAPVVRSAMRELGAPGDLRVYPEPGGEAERPVLLGEGSRKRIDVAVVHRLGGLRIDVSLKGLNFRDRGGGQFDKNLTGRTYELEDELRTVRLLQPATFVFALYWLPLGGATDKAKGESSFARTVLHLRARVHRAPPGVPRGSERLDGAAVALYAPTTLTVGPGEAVERGVVRCLDVLVDPPRRGRPLVETTLTMDGLVQGWVRSYLEATGVARPDWPEPEA